MAPTRSSRRLSPLQQTILWIVEQNEPCSVADAAMHAMVQSGSARSALTSLERRGLVGRTYTGHYRGSSHAYVITDAGSELAQEPEAAPGECWCCGRVGGHFRHCITNRQVGAS